MNKEIKISEAVNVIEEWGIDCDNFVANMVNYYSINGGDPDDNSIELGEYFLSCLKTVCDLGIKTYKEGY